MKWYQKKIRGWVVPFWCTHIPLYSKRFSNLSKEHIEKIINKIISKT